MIQADNKEEKFDRILVIDDDEAMAGLIGEILREQDFLPTIFHDGKSALQLCNASDCNFDLVITDICMPGLTGDEFAREVRKVNASIPIIFCSGYTDHTSKEKLLEIEGSRFIEKPINQNQLFQTIEELNIC